MSGFFVQKCFAQLFCIYSLGLYFFGKWKSAQKLLVNCWWNWPPRKDSQVISGKKVDWFVVLLYLIGFALYAVSSSLMKLISSRWSSRSHLSIVSTISKTLERIAPGMHPSSGVGTPFYVECCIVLIRQHCHNLYLNLPLKITLILSCFTVFV